MSAEFYKITMPVAVTAILLLYMFIAHDLQKILQAILP